MLDSSTPFKKRIPDAAFEKTTDTRYDPDGINVTIGQRDGHHYILLFQDDERQIARAFQVVLNWARNLNLNFNYSDLRQADSMIRQRLIALNEGCNGK